MKRITDGQKWFVATVLCLGYFVGTATAVPERLRPESGDEGAQLQPPARSERWQPVEVTNSMPRSFARRTANVVNRAELLSPAFDTLCLSRRALRVVQLGDSHVASGDYPAAVKQMLEGAWGAATSDADGLGVDYRYLARNGATAALFNTETRMQQVAAMKPDLVILSFGTNECHGWGYREEQHREQLVAFYDSLRRVCPQAVVMLTTPPGDYLRGRSGRRGGLQVNPMSRRCAAEIERFGRDHDLPVWDLNTIAGGEVAVRNWTAARLMRPDRIHFTPEGYQLHGRLLGEALLTAYNEYLGSGSSH